MFDPAVINTLMLKMKDVSCAELRFQALFTAYQVLSDPKSREGYDRVLTIRYYLHQVPYRTPYR